MEYKDNIFDRIMSGDPNKIPQNEIFIAILYELKDLNGKWNAMDEKVSQIAQNAMIQQKESEEMLLKRILALEIKQEEQDKRILKAQGIKELFGSIPTVSVIVASIITLAGAIYKTVQYLNK